MGGITTFFQSYNGPVGPKDSIMSMTKIAFTNNINLLMGIKSAATWGEMLDYASRQLIHGNGGAFGALLTASREVGAFAIVRQAMTDLKITPLVTAKRVDGAKDWAGCKVGYEVTVKSKTAREGLKALFNTLKPAVVVASVETANDVNVAVAKKAKVERLAENRATRTKAVQKKKVATMNNPKLRAKELQGRMDTLVAQLLTEGYNESEVMFSVTTAVRQYHIDNDNAQPASAK